MDSFRIVIALLVMTGCGVKSESGYQSTIIGSQEWMVKNLDKDHFNNGDPIPEAKTVDDWIKAGENKEPICSYYNFDSSYSENHGRLYNWYAVSDPRGLAPEGWRIPTQKEVYRLIDQVNEDGRVLKAQFAWGDNKDNQNKTGFTAIPSGLYNEGFFGGLNTAASWWCSTEYDDGIAFFAMLNSKNDDVLVTPHKAEYGFSIRCLRDVEKEVEIVQDDSFENEQKSELKPNVHGKTYSLEDLQLQFLDSRIDKVQMVFGEEDSEDILRIASDDFLLKYYIYYDKISVNGRVQPVVFFTLRDEREYDVVDKIVLAEMGDEVYWNDFTSIKLSSY